MPRYPSMFLLLLVIPAIHAQEPWANPAFKSPPGLALWLDASAQNAARKAQGLPALASGGLVDVLFDASGNKRNVHQRTQAFQPRILLHEDLALIRFDGKDDFLGATGLKESLGEFTLFLLVTPRSNPGQFNGFFACHETGKNDYVTGLNVDTSHGATPQLSQINIEGRGFGKAVNLMKKPVPFGRPRVIEVRGQRHGDGIVLFVDGVLQGQRKRENEPVSLECLVLGARCYSNTKEPPFVQGFFDGDIAEVLLYDNLLPDKVAVSVRDVLMKKAERLGEISAAALGHFLTPIADPPLVQMLVPGFSVRQLPLDLPNINNIRYRPDGKLLALGYNGNLYLLSDSDGDGLEDKADLFWENKVGLVGPIGMALTPPKYEHGQGAFIASKGKISLIVDTDGDDRADKEIVVATGWKPLPHGVDALGVALDKEGNIYFGLGTEDFTNAYLKDKSGKARYDLKNERGTIQKVSADFKKRETVCTGIRFPVGMAFNRHGDLFCTDQEGATWLPNGNPFDELLHIQKGRHYGFPPRHPKHLPDVIDEPSVFDYGPQHQSTCGLTFNEPANGGPVFGPEWWTGDAIVCGESRGKLYRTRLVKTSHGYVAQNQIIACLQMLTIDACVSPKGDLVVACHSGPPDWGTGPAGKGKLFKISYVDRKAPQPVIAWAQGPREVRIAFDRPLELEHLQELKKEKIKIEYGKYVRPGDRYETMKPPYAIVAMHWATPRHHLDVHSVQVTPDRRTVILQTTALPERAHYAVSLPWPTMKNRAGSVPQHAAMEVGFDLCGVQVEWTRVIDEKLVGETRRTWLPHLNLDLSHKLTAGSAEHEELWNELKLLGRLAQDTSIDLFQFVEPAFQEGAKADHEPDSRPLKLLYASRSLRSFLASDGSGARLFPVPEKGKAGMETHWESKVVGDRTKRVVVSIDHFSRKGHDLTVTVQTDKDKRLRELPLSRFVLPWAPTETKTTLAKRDLPQLKGGDRLRGQELFFGAKTQCSACHTHRGKGGHIGPDLSNLVHRDYDSVVRDINTPSAAINPDHLTYTILMDDGRFLTGVLRSKDEKTLILGTAEGKELTLRRENIEEMRPVNISTMPEGIDRKLTADEMRDLLTFLLTESAPKVSSK